MKLKDYKKKALKDPAFREEYERFDLLFELKMLYQKLRLKLTRKK